MQLELLQTNLLFIKLIRDIRIPLGLADFQLHSGFYYKSILQGFIHKDRSSISPERERPR
jgi:hypothetical protein